MPTSIDQESIMQFVSSPSLPVVGLPHEELYNSSEYIGVEIELENIHNVNFLRSLRPEIEAVNDGSLKFNGKELRFSSALNGSSIITALDKVENGIKEFKVQPYLRGNRGSTHIHINITDLNIKQLHDFVFLSYFCEPLLMDFCNEDRKHSPFAMTTNNTKDQREVLHCIKKGQLNFDQGLYKYRAIGLNSIYNKGSLEFRMFHSSYIKTEIVQWINFIQEIKYLAKTIPNIPDIVCTGCSRELSTTIKTIFARNIPVGDKAASQMWTFIRDMAETTEELKFLDCNQISNFYKQVTGE